jgi:exodeoxyribonuclease III
MPCCALPFEVRECQDERIFRRMQRLATADHIFQTMVIMASSKIVSLNVRSGGGRRGGAICQFLDSYQPEIVVITEWQESTAGNSFIEWSVSRSMHYASLNGKPNGVYVAAREPFHFESMTPEGEFTGALLLVRFPLWSLLACYFPQMYSKSYFFSKCLETAIAHEKHPFAIIGDFNTGNQLTDRSAAGSRYACADRFDALTREAGLVDLWRRTFGTGVCEWSWLSRANGFRIDHAFGNELFIQLMRPICVYDHTPRENKITDHSAIVVTLSRL